MVKETCLCGINVNIATLIISIIQLLLYLLFLILILLPNDHSSFDPGSGLNSTLLVTKPNPTSLNDVFMMVVIGNQVPKLIFISITIFVILTLMVGTLTKEHTLYYPYLCFKATFLLAVLFVVPFLFILAVLCIFLPMTLNRGPEEGFAFGVTLLKLAGILLIIDCLCLYFEFVVVNQSRKVLKANRRTTPVETEQQAGAEGEKASKMRGRNIYRFPKIEDYHECKICKIVRGMIIFFLICNVISIALVSFDVWEKLVDKDDTVTDVSNKSILDRFYAFATEFFQYRHVKNLFICNGLILVVLQALLLFGNCTKRHKFFWPYLIYQYSFFFTFMAVSVFLVGYSIYRMINSDGPSADHEIASAQSTLIFGLVAILCNIFQAYFTIALVNKSRKCIRHGSH